MFRSGSVEKLPSHLDVEERRGRSHSYIDPGSLPKGAPLLPVSKTTLAASSSVENITSAGERKTSRRKPQGTSEYIVKEGDTLVKIGAQFDVTPSELFKINKLFSWTVFVGQVLYIPDSHSSSPKSASPVHDSRLRGDSFTGQSRNYGTQAVPVQISVQVDEAPCKLEKTSTVKEVGKESLQKFLKMPARRVVEKEEIADVKTDTASESFTVKGALLVTPNAFMFDPDVSDPAVINSDHQRKFSVVIYMEEIRSVALFSDITPRMFWRQPKEMRTHSPRPKTYHSNQNPEKGDDVEKAREHSQHIASFIEEDTSGKLNQTVEITETCKTRKEDQHTVTSSQEKTSASHANKQISNRLELDVHESSQSQHESESEKSNEMKSNLSKPPSEVHHQKSSNLVDSSGHLDVTDSADITNEDPNQALAPIQFTDSSPTGQQVPVDTQSGNSCEDAEKDSPRTEMNSTSRNHTDSISGETFGASSETQKSLTSTTPSEVTTKPHATKIKPSSTNKKSSSKNSSENLKSAIGQLAFQVSHINLDSAVDKMPEPNRDSTDSKDRSHHSLFSLFHNPTPSTPSSYRLQLKSEFTKADISRVLGPDPKKFLRRSDSHYFEESPLFLQIRYGIRKNTEITQPRAFDHWNIGPMLNEYWFMVPYQMKDKLYTFLMAWQPDAYGNEEETVNREKFFYDKDTLIQAVKKDPATSNDEELYLKEDHFDDVKTWEIHSKQEVYGAEKQQTLHRQMTIDENNMPELMNTSCIIKQEHIISILQSLPWIMTVGYNWELVYGTHIHGYSLQNLYMKTEKEEEDSPMLLFIVDKSGSLFGAYLSNAMHTSESFYGTGATFLFTFYPTFKKFPWSGDNEFFMHGTRDFFAVGAGEGVFGLWLDSALDKGLIRKCPTFHNDILTKEEDFSVVQLEVWKFVETSDL